MALAVRGSAVSSGKVSDEVSRGQRTYGLDKGTEGRRWEAALALRRGSRNVTDRRLRGANGGSNEEVCAAIDDEGRTALSEGGKVKSRAQPSMVGDSICGGDGEGVPKALGCGEVKRLVVSSGAPGRQEEERNAEDGGPWGRPGEIGLRGSRNFRALLRRSCFFVCTVDASPFTTSSSGVLRTRSSRIGVAGAAELKDNRPDSAVKEMAVGVPM